MGKSRMGAAFLYWGRAQGADVLTGRTFQTSQRLPYRPLLEALRTRFEQEADLRQWLGDAWLTELSPLLPHLRGRYPDLPPPTLARSLPPCRSFHSLAPLSHAFAPPPPPPLF